MERAGDAEPSGGRDPRVARRVQQREPCGRPPRSSAGGSNDLFAELCAIPSPFGSERACADRVVAELRGAGPRGRPRTMRARRVGAATCWRAYLLRAHARPVASARSCSARTSTRSRMRRPDRAGRRGRRLDQPQRGDPRRRQQGGRGGDAGARPPDRDRGSPSGSSCCSPSPRRTRSRGRRSSTSRSCARTSASCSTTRRRSARSSWRRRRYFRIEATFHGEAAHAGIRPQDGRSAIVAAARAIAAMRLGRLDEETTANVGTIHGGAAGRTSCPTAARCWRRRAR